MANAVAIKPVSASQIPANRETNRELGNFRVTFAQDSLEEPRNLGAFLQIPYSAEQGIFLNEQGISLADQGINVPPTEAMAWTPPTASDIAKHVFQIHGA